MVDYQKKINERLDRYMPHCIVALNEAEDSKKYVDKAPQIKGYFKLISVRYMKRVSDIKKMCVEYINTFVDGALNIAKNMDDVKLCKGIDSLSTDLDFEAEGVSTNHETKKSDNKSGVLFLTMDKALKTKLDTIIEKVRERSKKSEMLREWATLMLLQSKITASDIIIDETTKMLKDEKTKKEQESKNEKAKKDAEQKLAALEAEHKKYQKDLNDFIEQYGEPAQWFKNKDVKLKDLVELANGFSEDDFSKALDEDSELKSQRLKFYDTYSDRKKADTDLEEELKDTDFNNLDHDIQNYIYACIVVDKSTADGSFIASPIDICIAVSNNKDAETLLKKQGRDKTVDGIDLSKYKIKFSDEAKAEEAFKQFIKDKSFAFRAVYYFSRLFSADKSVLAESNRIHVLKPSEFICEQMFDNTMSLADASLAIMDVLDDCEDGCLYVGNIPGFDEVDYIMLDGDGGWGMYAEHGDLQRALAGEGPQNACPVKLTDSHKLALLTTLFDKLTEDLASKLK